LTIQGEGRKKEKGRGGGEKKRLVPSPRTRSKIPSTPLLLILRHMVPLRAEKGKRGGREEKKKVYLPLPNSGQRTAPTLPLSEGRKKEGGGKEEKRKKKSGSNLCAPHSSSPLFLGARDRWIRYRAGGKNKKGKKKKRWRIHCPSYLPLRAAIDTGGGHLQKKGGGKRLLLLSNFGSRCPPGFWRETGGGKKKRAPPTGSSTSTPGADA